MVELSVVGKRLPRVDALEKITGKAVYGTEVYLPGLLHGKILGSPYAHARILNIDTSRAERLPGVKAVVTAEDTPKTRYGVSWIVDAKDEQMLAFDKVRYVGDEVAAVAAIDEDIAEEALELIRVEYEELPAVFEPEDALKEDAPRVFGDSNIQKRVVVTRGDINKGFQEADYIFEDRFRTQHVHQCHLELTDCVASWDASGKVTIWVTSMDPNTVRTITARALGMKESKIRVIQPVVGGAFGAKITLIRPYAICALLSRKTGRPVRVVNRREDDFSTTRPRLPMIIEIKTGVKKDGTLTAREIKAIADVGAYAGEGAGIMAMGMSYPVSLYKCPNIRMDGKTVYTNKLSMGQFRGYGGPQALFACETQMDMIAEKIGLDPIDLRLKNAIDKDEVTVLGWDVKSCGLRECIQKVAAYSHWYQKRKEKKPNRGLGLACSIFVSDCKEYEFGGSTAFVKIDEDGQISVRSGEIDYGQGAFTVFCQMAAEELGSSLDDVTFFGTDTDVTPHALGPWGDRVTVSGGNAVRLAAIDARRQLFEVAADMLEASPEDMELKNRKISVKGSPEKHLLFEEVAKAAVYDKRGSPIVGRGTDVRKTDFIDPDKGFAGNISSSYTFNAQIAEVEVDPNTGQVRVLHFATANDLGKAINPTMAEGQAESQIVQGLGFGLLEGLKFDGGKVMNPSFMEYRIPNSVDSPPIKVFLVEPIDPNGPYGAKGAGEPTIMPTAAALANAIYDAVGVRMKDLPITPEKIVRAIEAKSKK
ncbi:MAG: molybdopterin-dependent oxidoreductase [Chloroflexi bacterium]|nr:molybdopterin-dependent oxidoreductase [Chloroflexota bacterium]